MAKKKSTPKGPLYKRVKIGAHYVCRKTRGKGAGFVKGSKCGLKTASTSKGKGRKKASPKRSTAKKAGVHRDRSGRCRKGHLYATEATCKRYGI